MGDVIKGDFRQRIPRLVSEDGTRRSAQFDYAPEPSSAAICDTSPMDMGETPQPISADDHARFIRGIKWGTRFSLVFWGFIFWLIGAWILTLWFVGVALLYWPKRKNNSELLNRRKQW